MFAETSIVEPAPESRTVLQSVRTGCSKPIIRIDSLRVEYRGSTRKLALDDLNLAVAAGEVFGFLGPNGAGKTTTMNVLLGFVNATRGAAYIFGTNVRDPIARQR